MGYQDYRGDGLGADPDLSAPWEVLRGAASQNRDKWKKSRKIMRKIKLHKPSPSPSQWALTSIELELVKHANLSHIQKGIIDHTIRCCEEREAVLDQLFQVLSQGRTVADIAAPAGSWTGHSLHVPSFGTSLKLPLVFFTKNKSSTLLSISFPSVDFPDPESSLDIRLLSEPYWGDLHTPKQGVI